MNKLRILAYIMIFASLHMSVIIANTCNDFIPAEYDTSISYIEVDGICAIQAGEFVEHIQHDSKEFIFNPAIGENQVLYFTGDKVATIVQEDVFYLLEEGNEESREEFRDGIQYLGMVSLVYSLVNPPVGIGVGAAIKIIDYAEQQLFKLDKDYKIGIYDAHKEKKQEEAKYVKIPENESHRWQNDGTYLQKDGSKTPVINYYNGRSSNIPNMA